MMNLDVGLLKSALFPRSTAVLNDANMIGHNFFMCLGEKLFTFHVT